MEMKFNRNEWGNFKKPVKTLEELQEALDMGSPFITLYEVLSIHDGIIIYRSVPSDTFPDETGIELLGVQETSDGATAIVRILGDELI